MEISTAVVIGGLLAGLVLLLLVWRAVRFFVRLALVGIMLLLLFGGALLWWYGFGAVKNSPPPARRAERHSSR